MPPRRPRTPESGTSHTHVLWAIHVAWLRRRATKEQRTESAILRHLIDAQIDREREAGSWTPEQLVDAEDEGRLGEAVP